MQDQETSVLAGVQSWTLRQPQWAFDRVGLGKITMPEVHSQGKETRMQDQETRAQTRPAPIQPSAL